jgi:plastocyanin
MSYRDIREVDVTTNDRFHTNKISKRITTALLGVGFLALAACGSGGSSTDASSDPRDSTAVATDSDVVEMRLIAYRPAQLNVSTGATVRWQQNDAGFHTVTSGTVVKGATVKTNPDGKFDSGQIAKGKEFTHTFDEAGTFTYFCQIHPGTMNGQITVT